MLAILSVVKCSFAVSFYYVGGTLSYTRNQRQLDFKKGVQASGGVDRLTYITHWGDINATGRSTHGAQTRFCKYGNELRPLFIKMWPRITCLAPKQCVEEM